MIFRAGDFSTEKMKVLRSAVVMANEIPGSALLTFTRQGFMAQGLAMLRPAYAPSSGQSGEPELIHGLQMDIGASARGSAA